MQARLIAAFLLMSSLAGHALAQTGGYSDVAPSDVPPLDAPADLPNPNDIDPHTGLPKTFEQRHPEMAHKFVTPLPPLSDTAAIEELNNFRINVLKVKQGYGWCRYIDKSNHDAYYSDIFPGDPKYDIQPRDQAFMVYLERQYNLNVNELADIYCSWSQYSEDFSEKEYENRDQYAYILQSFSVKSTAWHP